MARLARLEPAIARALRSANAVAADDIARDVYHLEASQDPTASQRAVVTRAMRGFVRKHKALALAGGRGRTPLYIVRASAKALPDWLAFPRPPIRQPPEPKPLPLWEHNALGLIAGTIQMFTHWELHAEMPPELRAKLQQAGLMLLKLAGEIEDHANRKPS